MKSLGKMALIVGVLMALFGGCDKQSKEINNELAILQNAPTIGPAQCLHDTYESYNFSLTSYKDSSIIKYYLDDPPDYTDGIGLEIELQRAFEMWQQHLGKPVIQVYDSSKADIYVTYQFLDGIGGILGQTEFPPYTKQSVTPKVMAFDKYDLPRDQGEGLQFDFFSIALHETGHSLGLQHSHNSEAVMYPMYSHVHSLHIDDILGIRSLYNFKRPFLTGKHTYSWIDTSNKFIAPNFRVLEFHSQCPEIPGKMGHYLDMELINAVQFIRTYYNCPIKVLSSYRTYECNFLVDGAPDSQHMTFNAVDWKFIGPAAAVTHAKFTHDIQNKSSILAVLLGGDIRGIGIYPTSAHFDTRSTGGRQEYFGFSYASWGMAVPGQLIFDTPIKCAE